VLCELRIERGILVKQPSHPGGKFLCGPKKSRGYPSSEP
jgi:hypothetical protein